MSKVTDVYTSLCLLSVFRGLLDKKLFKDFMSYCEENDPKIKLKRYGELVAEIYKNGANLAGSVRKYLFEDENVFVVATSKGQEISPVVKRSVEKELNALSEFASLTASSFKIDMGTKATLPEYETEAVNLKKEYDSRLSSIDKYGYGIFASYGMFSVGENGEIIPIMSADKISLDSFVGYHEERQRVIDNTLAFLSGKPAANILLYGDAGTGKSSTVKAVVNHLFDRGLRLVEIRKNQLLLLPKIMGEISKNPLKFIIFIDDLSFNQNDDSFSMLKATLEGSASAKASNAVIYATSNRRHIVKESFGDREGSDIHRNDTVQETLSLSERFGLTVLFGKPNKLLYLEIVNELAQRAGITMDKTELETKAEAFALNRGYRSARCAEQFIDSLI
ncbi:MAG: ATP-binding protein [Clostridia bacterium]|nr:ATP-binding protein [Clostridia bacterium]MBQ7907840.1 ATP-binding protein [Clostridia bacterium]